MTENLVTENSAPATGGSFNLIDEPWISCLMVDGGERLLSLSEAIRRAEDISRISGDSPHQATAVLRLLLVIFWRAHLLHGELGDPDTEPEDWWTDLLFDEDDEAAASPVIPYLESHRERFWLFHPRAPFFQVADLHKKDESFDPVSRLIPEAENDYFALRAGRGRASLGAGEAARWLVCVQAYDYAGIKPGAVGDPRMKQGKGYPIGPGWSGQAGLVVLHGRHLRETLLLNTPASLLQSAHYQNPDDLPPWERAPDGPAPRSTEAAMPEGPCDLLTWQSRRARLHCTGDEVTGVLISNGDKIQNKNQFADPMTAYRYSKNQSTKLQTVHMPQEHDPDLTVWRALAPILSRTPQGGASQTATAGRVPSTVEALQELSLYGPPEDFTVVTELVGAKYGAQQSSHADTIHAVLPLRLSFLLSEDDRLAQTVVTAGESALNATSALGQFAGALQQAAGGDYVFKPAPRQAVLHDLEGHFSSWLTEVVPGTDLEQALRTWQLVVRGAVSDEARTHLGAISPQAMIGTYTSDDPPRLVSGASAWAQLHRRLDTVLPLTTTTERTLKNETAQEGA